MKVIVCGSYDFQSPAHVWRELDRLHAELGFTELMQFGTPGVDRYARDWATRQKFKCHVSRTPWSYGTKAATNRDVRMREWKPDLLIVFPGGFETAELVKRATAAGVEVRHVPGPASPTRRS